MTALPAPPGWVKEALGSPTGRGVRVGIIDSGYDRTLADPRVLPGVSFVDPDDDFALGRSDDDHDRLGHGTACADLVLRIAPEAEVVPIRVFGNQLETSPSILHAALVWAVEQGLRLVNVSLGTMLEGTLHPLYAVCEKGRRNGTVFVAAGHNARTWSYPAIFENVVGVAADRFSSPFEYRYRPDEAMECEAWGVDQPVLWLGGERVVKNGTSFAAPNITGIVALFLERHPAARLEEVRALLQRFALPEEAPAGRGRRGPAHARHWGLVVNEMLRLEALGLGRRERVSPLHERFVLAERKAAALLAEGPVGRGFIRAGRGSLLFRHASARLRNAVPAPLRARAMQSKQGLEFRWTQLGAAEIRTLFDAVLRVAREGGAAEPAPTLRAASRPG